MVQPLHIRGAHIWNGSGLSEWTTQRDLYTTDVVTDQPANNALTVDLDGYTIFPGLINAHDHLELNHYPRSKFREKYDNAHQWGEEMNARLDSEPYKSLRAYPLWDKLFIGGLKNLLCGATTVAHHNPPHKELWRKDFPVRVLRKYGWTHSLHFSTDAEVIESYRKTPQDVPWFIHLAEGTDEIAAGEYDKLRALGCADELGREHKNVYIHCVGFNGVTEEQYDDGRFDPFGTARGAVWCPSTNDYLLGQTINQDCWFFPEFLDSGPALGSDSRLTADGDLLDEMRAARKYIYSDSLIDMVTNNPVLILGLHNKPNHERNYYLAGRLDHLGAYADFIAVRSTENDVETLCNSHRADLALVVKGGVPQIGDPDVMAKFPHLARRIHQNQLKEPGLTVDELPKRKFVLW